jgi:hypothetical protein
VWVGTRFQQQLAYSLMTVRGRQGKSRSSAAVGCVHMHPPMQVKAHDRLDPGSDSHLQQARQGLPRESRLLAHSFLPFFLPSYLAPLSVPNAQMLRGVVFELPPSMLVTLCIDECDQL